MSASLLRAHAPWAACAAMLLASPLPAHAQVPGQPGYLLDGSGHFVGSATPGECWHTGFWTPAMATPPCDGAIAATAVVVPVAPAPQPPAPAPAPVVVAVVLAPTVTRFSADALFGFDKSALNSEGMNMLDGLATQLRGTRYDAIHVTGHTDRMGTPAYNQKLSERRASTVGDYLVSRGVAASAIDAKGLGETQPLSATTDCTKGTRAQHITCLAPDRRVDVEVQSTPTSTP